MCCNMSAIFSCNESERDFNTSGHQLNADFAFTQSIPDFGGKRVLSPAESPQMLATL